MCTNKSPSNKLLLELYYLLSIRVVVRVVYSLVKTHLRAVDIDARSYPGPLCPHRVRRRRRAARSLTSQGRAEPLCARIESANREVSEGKADL